MIYTEQMDVAVLGDRLPEMTQKPFLGSTSACSTSIERAQPVLAGLVFCEMLSQCPQSAFQGSPRVAGGGQQQFATQTLRVHLLGIEMRLASF